MLTFGDLLRRRRVGAGLSQEALAERAGLSMRGVSDLERGVRRAPYRDTVLRLAEALGLGGAERQELMASSRRPCASVRISLADQAKMGLPAYLSSFVGRTRELAEVRRLLGTTRLLTLTGPGGVGKTRLAVRVAENAVEAYADGVWLVDLAPLADPGLVPQAVAAAVSVREQPGHPLQHTLTEALHPRQVLLVLDNCEHLLEACAQLAEALLRACPDLRILATSREVLRIAGETAWRVPPLGLPPLVSATPSVPPLREQVEDSEAVQLFIARAAAALPGFTLTDANAPTVARICHQLDGLPLATELAAARVSALGLEQLAARLADRFRLLTAGSRTALLRHQTLRAALEWSYALLTEPEQRLFERLAVFAGGWTLAAAEAVGAGDGIESADVPELLAHLVDKSLVAVQEGPGAEPRYRLLEMLREYALERLADSGELDSVAARHARYFVDVAERAEPELRGPDQVSALERLAADNDNLRGALDWAAQTGAVADGLRIGGALWRFWQFRAEYAEPRARLERLLGLTPAIRTQERARALACTGILAFFQGDHDAARLLLEESLSLQRDLDDRHGIAFMLVNLAILAASRDERDLAGRLAEEAVAVARAGGGDWVLFASLSLLGTLVHLDGDSRRGRALCAEALAVVRKLGDHRGVANALLGLGTIVHAEGDAAAALPILEEATSRLRLIGDRGWLPGALAQLALAELDLSDRSAAVSHLEESLVLARASGARPGMLMALEGFACLLAAEGRSAPARRLAGAAHTLREDTRVRGPSPMLAWRRQVERRLAPVHPAYRAGVVHRQDELEDPPPELEQAILEALAVGTELVPSAGS